MRNLNDRSFLIAAMVFGLIALVSFIFIHNGWGPRIGLASLVLVVGCVSAWLVCFLDKMREKTNSIILRGATAETVGDILRVVEGIPNMEELRQSLRYFVEETETREALLKHMASLMGISAQHLSWYLENHIGHDLNSRIDDLIQKFRERRAQEERDRVEREAREAKERQEAEAQQRIARIAKLNAELIPKAEADLKTAEGMVDTIGQQAVDRAKSKVAELRRELTEHEAAKALAETNSATPVPVQNPGTAAFAVPRSTAPSARPRREQTVVAPVPLPRDPRPAQDQDTFAQASGSEDSFSPAGTQPMGSDAKLFSDAGTQEIPVNAVADGDKE